MKRKTACFLGIGLTLALLYLPKLPEEQRKTEPAVEFEKMADLEGYQQAKATKSAKDTKKSKISLSYNGKICNLSNEALFLGENRTLMIPEQVLRDQFYFSAHMYQKKTMELERGQIRVTIRKNKNQILVKKNGKTSRIAVKKPLQSMRGTYYISSEVLRLAFDFSYEWNEEQYMAVIRSENGKRSNLPASYDYRKRKRAPKVYDQGEFGTCWAFASLTALESSLLPEERVQFSKEHMVLGNSFSTTMNSGGDYVMSLAYLTAWQGPVLASQDAYGDQVTPRNLKASKHLQEAQIVRKKKLNEIKEMVYRYGGVQSSLYTSLTNSDSESVYYNRKKAAYCYRGKKKANHDVVIIGWDDHYPKENFTKKVKKDGAFICRNSWGSEFGDRGDFYVSYYDSNIGVHNLVYTKVEDKKNYDRIYQTDQCGWVGKLGYSGQDDAYFSNVYQAKEKEKIQAVGFYAPSRHAEYEVYVCENFKNKKSLSGYKKIRAQGTFTNAGYYTVKLEEPVTIKKGRKFAVIMYLKTPGHTKPIAIEYKNDLQTKNVDLSDGEGYYSLKGSSWNRAEKENFNICLKAYADRIK